MKSARKIFLVVDTVVVILLLLASACIIWSLTGCGGGGSGPTDEYGDAVLSGKVTEVGNGNPIAAAGINLSFNRETMTTTTSSTGNYTVTVTQLKVANPTSIAVTTSKSGYKPLTKYVALAGKGSVVLDFQLEKTTIPMASLKGRVVDDQNQPVTNATVKLTVRVGITDLVVSGKSDSDGRYNLSVTLSSPSTAQVTVSADGFVSRSDLSASMTVGQVSTLDVTLEPVVIPKGTLKVTSTPFGCAVTVNGTAVGTTPLSINKPTGTYTVACSKANFNGQQKSVTISAAQTTNVHFWLKLKAGVEQTGTWHLEYTGRSYGRDHPTLGKIDWCDLSIAPNGTTYLSGGVSGYVIAYNQSGNLVWTSPGYWQLEGIACDSQNDIWVVAAEGKIVQFGANKSVKSQTTLSAPHSVRVNGQVAYFLTGGSVGGLDEAGNIAFQATASTVDNLSFAMDQQRETMWLINLGDYASPGLQEIEPQTGQTDKFVGLPGIRGTRGLKIPNKDLFLVTSASQDKIFLLDGTGRIMGNTVVQDVPTGITLAPNGQVHVVSGTIGDGTATGPYVKVYNLISG